MPKILVIEDEDAIRKEVVDWLRFENYEVVGAPNGRIGLEMIYQELPDLIVCDIAMPEVDGHEVLIEVRSNPQWNRIPFIFLTAAADRDSIREGMNMGADDYLTKPFTHAEVLNAVRARLDKKLAQESQVQAQIEFFQAALSEEREKRLLKSRLVAMFSHDFRNPLTTIMSSSNIIRNYEARLSPEQKQTHFDRIDGSVHLLTQMLDEMLMVAEMEGGHLKCNPCPTDLVAFVGAIVEEFRIIHSRTHTFVYQGWVKSSVLVDPKLFRQIVTNLLSNAVKYSAPHTTVTINLLENSHNIELTVEDQGIGIPANDLSHIFEPYLRASNVEGIKGTGLGLAIVKQAVDLHGGTVTVTSEINQWARFVVRLPRP